MQVFTPSQLAKNTGSKYLGVLVAAKYGRELNALPRDAIPAAVEKKLATRALEAMVSGDVEYRLAKRRSRGEQ